MAVANRKPAPQPQAAVPTASVPVKPELPEQIHVLDLTAIRTAENPEGKRVHDMEVDGIRKSFTFEPGKPLPMAPAVAMKFLRHEEGFKRTDAEGNLMPYKRRPKQPEELQAGEKLDLKDDETIANYDELSNRSLQQRVIEMRGGEKFAKANPSRQAMIDFIVADKRDKATVNAAKEPDVDGDGYTPDLDWDEEAA